MPSLQQGQSQQSVGQVYNVHDDGLPTCADFLKQYRREVKKVRVLRIPYAVMMLLSRRVEKYHVRSKGQLPAIFTPYKTAASWKGTKFDNGKLKDLGWRQMVSTEEGLRRTFADLKAQVN